MKPILEHLQSGTPIWKCNKDLHHPIDGLVFEKGELYAERYRSGDGEFVTLIRDDGVAHGIDMQKKNGAWLKHFELLDRAALTLLKEDNRPEEKETFKPCGEGDNVCNCKSAEECGYSIDPKAERIKELEGALRNSLSMMEQTLVYRNANGLKFGNTFLESAIEQANTLLSK